MSTCKIIGILLSALGVLSTGIATFAPGWLMSDASGEHLVIGFIYTCVKGQCGTYQGFVSADIILMIIACVLQVEGVLLCLFGQVKKNSTLLKLAGGVQIVGGLACFAATVLFTVDAAAILGDKAGIWPVLHYGYSYGFAWVGGVLAIAAAIANIYATQQNMDSLPTHIPLY